MTEFDKLVAHLKNLQQRNVKNATFDVSWLVAALQISPTKVISKKEIAKPNSPQTIEVDGGTFKE